MWSNWEIHRSEQEFVASWKKEILILSTAVAARQRQWETQGYGHSGPKDVDLAAAGAVEFAEKYPLPRAQDELAVLDRDGDRSAHQA
jgi:hypothetical protein